MRRQADRDRAPAVRRAIAALLLAALPVAGGSAAAAEGVVERIESAVYAAVDRWGSADLAAAQADIEASVPDDPRAQALARALVEQARGRESAAVRALLAGIRVAAAPAGDEGAVSSADALRVTAALLGTMLDLGAPREARRIVAASEQPVVELAHAALLAQEDRCAEALAIVDRVRVALPPLVEPALLAARTLERCGREATALAWLEAAVEGPGPPRGSPRVALAVGELLLAAGDSAAAGRWCDAARAAASPVAPYRHRAAACAALADALAGRLPSGRDRYTEALRGAQRDGSLPLADREAAGLAAAWVLSSSIDPGLVRDAGDVLDELEILPISGRTRAAIALVRARIAARLERSDEAGRLIATTRIDRRGDPELAAIAGLVDAELALLRGERETAAARLADALELAQRAAAPALVAEIHVDRMRVALADAEPARTVERALEALAAWREVSLPGRTPFVDPTLPRRALELALTGTGLAEPGTPAEAAAAMLLARRILRAASPAAAGAGDELPSIEDVRRALASRDATLVVFGIGLRRSWAWLADSVGVRAVQLPRGDALHARFAPFLIEDEQGYAGPASWGGQVVAGMVGISGGEQTLYVMPDGFLDGLPWALLGGGAGRDATGDAPTAVPTLETLTRAPLVPAHEITPRAVTLATERTAVVADVGRDAWWRRWFPPGLARERVVTAGGTAAALVAALRRPAALWSSRLPLLVAGPGEDVLALARRQTVRELGPVPTADLDALLAETARPAVLILAPDGGWAGVAPASVARTAGRAVAGGVGASVVVLAREAALADAVVERVERGLGAGRSVREAVVRALADLPDTGYPYVGLVGDPETRIRPPRPPYLKVWLPAGAGIAIVLVVLARTLWRRRDPFDIEPPEES